VYYVFEKRNNNFTRGNTDCSSPKYRQIPSQISLIAFEEKSSHISASSFCVIQDAPRGGELFYISKSIRVISALIFGHYRGVIRQVRSCTIVIL